MSETNRIEELQRLMEQLPSERDWDVYQMVRVEQWPKINAAKEFRLSLTNVCQIVQRTANFVAEIAPTPTKEDEARHLAAGKQLAAERIDFLYGEALSCFRTSKGNEKVIHQEAGHAKDRATIRRNLGDLKYLYAAARLAIMASTLPPPRLSWRTDQVEEMAAAEAAAENAAEEAAEAQAAAKETCSTPEAEQPEVAAEPKPESSATAAAMLGCVEQSRAKSAANRPGPRPVQPTPQAARREAFFQPG